MADARFAVIDGPDDPLLADALAAGVIVRTRADADLEIDPARHDVAMASGAQIISTDFPPSEPRDHGYRVEFPGGVLVQGVPS